MTGIEAGTVVKELLKVGARPSLERAKRNAGVLRLLKQLGMSPRRPPADFDGVYAFALVQHCWGAPEFIVNFFGHPRMKEAFRQAYEEQDPTTYRREADHLFQLNTETRELGWLDYDPRQDLGRFWATFETLVASVRTPIDIRLERHVHEGTSALSSQLDEVMAALGALDGLAGIQESIRYLTDQFDPQPSAYSDLQKSVRGWLEAVGYKFEAFEHVDETSFSWIINIPVRRGRYERVLVRAVDREARMEDVEDLKRAVVDLRVDEAWLVAGRRVSGAARECSRDSTVLCYTLDELIDQDADFEPYLEWLEAEVDRKGISSRYVPVAARKEEVNSLGTPLGSYSTYDEKRGWVDGYVDTWLDDTAKEHLSVLGEFGTGKTWFCLHYAWRLAEKYRDAKVRGLARPRLPIVIPLRDYAKAVSVESLFSDFFFRRHQLNLPGYAAFEHLNRMGRLLVIFDGFDEMAARVDRQTMINNFWELAKSVVPGAKVILTCRTEHFPAAQEGRALLGAELRASTSALTGEPPQFEILELLPWTDAQVEQVLGFLTNAETVRLIMGHREMLDLLRRPVMSDLVVDALPEVQSGKQLDTARVYLYATRRKMARDIRDERTFTTMGDKLYFLCEVAWEMLSTDKMSLNYRHIPDHIRRCFGSVVEDEKDLDHWHYDMMGQTMLIRNAEGDYYPAHRSLLEFFVAYKLAAELGMLGGEFLETLNEGQSEAVGSGDFTWERYFQRPSPRGCIAGFAPASTERLRATLGKAPLTHPTVQMLLSMLSLTEDAAVTQLVDLVRATGHSKEQEWGVLGGNSATLAVRLKADAFAGLDLQNADISHAMLDLGGGRSSAFNGTNLANSDCREVDFENVSLVGASLSGADLSGSEYLGLERRCVAWMELEPDGSVILLTRAGEILRLSLSGAQSTVTHLLSLPGGRDEVHEGELSPCGRFLIVQAGTVHVVDLHAAEIIVSSTTATGAVFALSEGQPSPEVVLLHRGGDEHGFDQVDLQTGKSVGLTTVPNKAIAGFYSPSLKGTFLYTADGKVLVYRSTGAGQGDVFQQVAELRQPGLRYDPPSDSSEEEEEKEKEEEEERTRTMHAATWGRDVLWTSSASRDQGADGQRVRLRAVTLMGEELWQGEYFIEDRDVVFLAYAPRYPGAWGLLETSAQRAVTFDDDGIRWWRGAEQVGFHAADSTVVDAEVITGSSVLFSDRYCGIWSITFEPGDPIMVANTSENHQGLDLRGVRGVPPRLLARLAAMGAQTG